MLKSLYFCENCRKKVENVAEIHFVEENSDRGFCSEKCIMEFYRPYMIALEEEEYNFRKNCQIENEDDHSHITANEHYLDLALTSPLEIWHFENDFEQSFYTHIFKLSEDGEDIFFILICAYIDGGPSFVFYRLATKYKSLVDKYRRDTKFDKELPENSADSVENSSGKVEVEIPTEVIEMLESKKSQMLAEMMINRSSGDIQFELFHKYDSYLDQTIQNPDEVYENEDDEGDEIYTYIRSFKQGDIPFFYVVICYLHQIGDGKESAVLPIIGFPSIDEMLYPKYAIGKKLNEKLKN